MDFVYGAVTLFGPPFQSGSTIQHVGNSVESPATLLSGPTTPMRQRRWAITPHRFRLVRVRSPLLTESLLLSFPRATEMFQFTRFPLSALCVQAGVPVHDDWRVSPFGYPRITGRSAPPRGLSQPPTSFIGSCCQGIHRWPFVAWDSCSTKMLVLAMKFSRGGGPKRRRTQQGRRGANASETARHFLTTEERSALERVHQLGIYPSIGRDSLERR